jgi:hypothetical protein
MVTGYTAFFDVSRGPEPVYTMAGYIGRVEKWEAFKSPWQKLLADEGLKKPFSPASLESRVGEYYGWSNTKAISFQQRAFQLINKAREVAIGHSLSIRDFKRLEFRWIQEPHAESKSHYYHCAACLLRNVQWWIDRNRIDEPIEYIFEFGDEGWGDILKLLDEINADPAQRESYRMQGYSRKFKKDVIQLQAAGTWAYESYKHWSNTLPDRQKRKTRDSFKPLFRQAVDGGLNTFDDKAAFDAMIKTYLSLGGLATKGGVTLKLE